MQIYITLFLLVLLTTSLAPAKMRLAVWQVKNSNAPLILPVRESESYAEASQRYIKNISKQGELSELFEGRTPYFETVRFKELSEVSSSPDDRVLLQANRADDYTSKSHRVDQFNYYFKRLKQQSFLLLINPTVGLTLNERKQVFDLIYDQFAIYAGLGGDDVDPRLSQQENYHSRNTNLERDRAEIELIRHFVRRGQEEKDKSKKSFYFGTCRGSQLASVALGYKLIQDIPIQVESVVAHGYDWHSIKLLQTSHGILQDLSPTTVVNSIHHQSVIFKKGGFLELAALSPDGIVEATEFKNGRGLLTQFHSELMEDATGFHILTKVIRAKDKSGHPMCQKLFSRN